MIKQFIFCILSLALLTRLTIHGNEQDSLPHSESIISEKYFSELDLTELTLKNGMKVILKPTQFEEGEVMVHLSALGGFSSLEPKDRASGQLSAQIAWESGLGDMSSDQLSVHLYDQSLEMVVNVKPFSRVIEANGNEDNLESMFKLINQIFKSHHFKKESYDKALVKARQAVNKMAQDTGNIFEEAFKDINTHNLYALRPLSIKDIDRANYEISKQFYNESFTNPADFICVIVGDFNIEKMKKMIKDNLVINTDFNTESRVKKPPFFQFPKEVTTKVVPLPNYSDSLTRITYPISVPIDHEKIQKIELACQIIQTKIRKAVKPYIETTHGITVSYEYPLYPFQELPWLTIQFHGPKKLVNLLTKTVIAEIQLLRNTGPSQEEINTVMETLKKADAFWFRDNSFWVSALTNYYMWGWDPTAILNTHKSKDHFSQEDMKLVLQTYINWDDYTVLSGQP